MGSLMSLLTTSSVLRSSTRMKLPEPAESRSKCFTVTPCSREATEMAGRSVAWDTREATFSIILSTRCILSSMAALMDRVSSMLNR
mgnify:CR=1 FL=1